jgi:DNA-binding GntR family transcriptional regulator
VTTVHDGENPPGRRRGFRAVANVLRERVEAGNLPGGRLSPEDALATEFGVARETVRRALAVLIDEGLIRSTHGRGHFVVRHDDEEAGMPRYLVVAQKLRARIAAGDFRHEVLPAEAEIQAEYEVSRNTARRAFTELETWGLVERRGGRRYAHPDEQ